MRAFIFFLLGGMLGLFVLISPAPAGETCLSVPEPPKRFNNARFVQLKNTEWDTGQTLRILFMGGTAAERKLVRETATEWTKYANLNFKFYNSPSQLGGAKSDIRITFDKNKGSHSAVGTHATLYSQNESTMNFGWNSKSTILHEFGHALGLRHEHQNPSAGIQWNKPVVYEHFKKIGWSQSKVDMFVIKALDRNTVNFGKYDPASIMVYTFPAEWTLNGMSSSRNGTLSAADKAGIAQLYPGRNENNSTEITLPTTLPTVTTTTSTTTIPSTTTTTNTTSTQTSTTTSTEGLTCNGRPVKISRVMGNRRYIVQYLDTGKKALVFRKNCSDFKGTTTSTPTTTSARISEGDRVSCSGKKGKVTRTIGKKLLVDFDNGKRDILRKSKCKKL